MTRRVVVVGGGIAGVTVAERLAAAVAAAGSDIGPVTVELLEASAAVGGKLRTTPFAGRAGVDEGADAFLTRVPHATALAARVGLDGALTSPASASAFVWHGRLHTIPDGLLLGVPADVRALVATRLLSVRGKARAAIEPVLPRRPDGDSIGRLVRYRFGDEVHERLVDALIGSIYAADTDRFSLAMVPQLATLATGHRSLLLAARAARAAAPPAGGPIFAVPLEGMQRLATATAARAAALGATISNHRPVTAIAADRSRWRIDDGEPAHAVVLATPAASTAALVARAAPELARLLTATDHADVAIVTMTLDDWPERLRGHSGYLVPKPDQGLVTAVSFGSQKWAHWRGDGELLRVSLGRDGVPIGDHDDDALVAAAVAEPGRHLELDLQPSAVRVSRWPAGFPQYRPGHRAWLAAVDAVTPPGVFLTGASYRGIGVPACIADAEHTADDVLGWLRARR